MGFGSGSSCDINLITTLNQEQRAIYQNPDTITTILTTSRNIAIVGLSTENHKASNMVASYLQDERYRIIPVNPKADSILGEKCYPDLLSIPTPIDIVDIFRPANEIESITEQAIQCKVRYIWMQLRIVNLKAAQNALESGINVIMNKCIKMEHGRYSGGLHSAGMNTEVISAKRRIR